VVFFSDNGGPTGDNTSRNDPLRGFKATTWEGGIRVPFVISWKNTLPAGKVEDRPIIQLDILPTALAAAGVTVKPEWKLDGVNLLPYLTGAKTDHPHDVFYWRFGQQIAIRKGDWKLVKASSPGQRAAAATTAGANTDGAELYNLAKDISETNNLARAEPEKVKELAAAWKAWNAELQDPAWGPGNRQRRGAGRVSSNASTNGPWKSGDLLSGDDAPQVAGHSLVITSEIEGAAANGVIVAQGASKHGYALYLQEGRLQFAVRVAGELTVIAAGEPLAPGQHRVEARLGGNGELALLVDGKSVAAGKAPGPIAGQPAEPFSVGQDANSPVGEYEAPNNFSGKVRNVRVEVR
jgi:hypothetical protein